ncbi:MAG: DUF6481 family protein [Hyphomonadaceae bacterium]
MSFQNHNERREAAEAAKKAMLEKFKTKTQAEVDPAIAAARAAEAKVREEKRIAAEQKRRERVDMERLQRKIAAEEKAKAEAEAARVAADEAERKRVADAEAAEILAFEQKARRDLKYAARKARQAGKK